MDNLICEIFANMETFTVKSDTMNRLLQTICPEQGFIHGIKSQAFNRLVAASYENWIDYLKTEQVFCIEHAITFHDIVNVSASFYTIKVDTKYMRSMMTLVWKEECLRRGVES